MEEKLNLILDELKKIREKIEKIDEALIGKNFVEENVNKEELKFSQENSSETFSFSALEKNLGIERKKIENFIKLDENDFILNFEIIGKSAAEKQVRATLIILTVNYYLTKSNSMTVTILNKKLKWLGISALASLSANLKSQKDFISKKGKIGSNNFNYEINFNGIQQGLTLLKEIIN